MTEAEWRTCVDPTRMLMFLRRKVSERKLRLFACACNRRNWELVTNKTLRVAIETGEQFADGAVSQRRRGSAFAAAAAVASAQRRGGCIARAASVCAAKDIRTWITTAWHQSVCAACKHRAVTEPGWAAKGHALQLEETPAFAAMLHDIIGNPFHPIAIHSSWLAWNDGAIRKMAQAIYAARAFDRLPLLADALEDAGCTDADILGHLRGPGQHVRGCWVLDALLGKS